MDYKIVAPCLDGRKGGLLLVWKKEVRIYSRTTTFSVIDVTVEEQDGREWRLSCIYGEPSWDNKDRTYRLLRDLHAQSSLPWVAIGDFNEILRTEEQFGPNERDSAQMEAFREAADVCALADLGYRGLDWTREKKVAGGHYCRVRLDRALPQCAGLGFFHGEAGPSTSGRREGLQRCWDE